MLKAEVPNSFSCRYMLCSLRFPPPLIPWLFTTHPPFTKQHIFHLLSWGPPGSAHCPSDHALRALSFLTSLQHLNRLHSSWAPVLCMPGFRRLHTSFTRPASVTHACVCATPTAQHGLSGGSQNRVGCRLCPRESQFNKLSPNLCSVASSQDPLPTQAPF